MSDKLCQVFHNGQWITGKLLLEPNEEQGIKGWEVFLYIGFGHKLYVTDPNLIRIVRVEDKEIIVESEKL